MESQFLDRAIGWFAPSWALARLRSRVALQNAARLYDAAQTSPFYKPRSIGDRSADAVMENAQSKLRSAARDLDENHDIAIGVLDALVDGVVGTGIVVEPQVRRRDGELAEELNVQLKKIWSDFWRYPEVTRELPGSMVERQLVRSTLRDGEVLVHHVMGRGQVEHATALPYSLELLEADFLPFTMLGKVPANVFHGVEKNGWGRPIAYHIYKNHPGHAAFASISGTTATQTKRVPAELITHLKFTRRLGQTRGITILHGVLNRLDSIKDGEESELIAMRVAAAFCAVITRGPEFIGTTSGVNADGSRAFKMQPGQVFDQLMQGEDVKLIGPNNRPNTNMIDFVNANLRRIAAGTGTTHSTVARDYEGSYSSKRQEAAEAEPAYAKLRGYFIGHGMKPIYRRAIDLAETAGLFRIPNGIDPATLFDVDMRRGGGALWIDPLKEVQADVAMIDAGITSRTAVIRRRGGDPSQVDAEIDQDDFEPKSETTAPGLTLPVDDQQNDQAMGSN